MDLVCKLKFMLWKEDLIHVPPHTEINRLNKKHGGLGASASLQTVRGENHDPQPWESLGLGVKA